MATKKSYNPFTFARQFRKKIDYDGTIKVEDLKGKYIEYVDQDSRIMLRKIVKVGPKTVKVVDVVKKKHDVRHELILFAYPRRGDKRKLEIIP